MVNFGRARKRRLFVEAKKRLHFGVMFLDLIEKGPGHLNRGDFPGVKLTKKVGCRSVGERHASQRGVSRIGNTEKRSD
jgi:hypothetical protein